MFLKGLSKHSIGYIGDVSITIKTSTMCLDDIGVEMAFMLNLLDLLERCCKRTVIGCCKKTHLFLLGQLFELWMALLQKADEDCQITTLSLHIAESSDARSPGLVVLLQIKHETIFFRQ